MYRLVCPIGRDTQPFLEWISTYILYIFHECGHLVTSSQTPAGYKHLTTGLSLAFVFPLKFNHKSSYRSWGLQSSGCLTVVWSRFVAQGGHQDVGARGAQLCCGPTGCRWSVAGKVPE